MIGSLKRYFSQNSKWFLVSLSVWIAAIICAIVCAAGTEGKVFDETFEYVSASFANGASVRTLLGNAIYSDFKYVLFITLSSTAPVLLPITMILIAFKGFSAGFTATMIIKIYSLKGIALSMLTIVLPMFFSLPVYFVIFVSTLKYSGEKLKLPSNRKGDEKKLTSHLLSQFILFGLLCITDVIQALFTLTAQTMI